MPLDVSRRSLLGLIAAAPVAAAANSVGAVAFARGGLLMDWQPMLIGEAVNFETLRPARGTFEVLRPETHRAVTTFIDVGETLADLARQFPDLAGADVPAGAPACDNAFTPDRVEANLRIARAL